MTMRGDRINWPVAIAVASLLLFGLIYTLGYLRLESRWWYQDDPALFAYASTIAHPLRVLTDPSVLRGFTTGKALVPGQLLSYWVDVRIAGFSPRFAYAHQIGSFLITLLLLFGVLKRLLGENSSLAAVSISILWALLPATAVVVQFLSTRHYLEGLLFALLSVYLLIGPRPYWGAAIACAVVAMLYKEIYAVIPPLALILYAWNRRERAFALISAAVGGCYVAYRFWMLGPALDYNMAFLSAPQYLKFLFKLPYTISANYGGYLLSGVLAALGYWFLRSERGNYRMILCFLAALALSLAAVAPVSAPLYGTIRSPGTWYRIVFFLQTIVIATGGYLAVRATLKKTQAILAVLALAVLLPGLDKTRRLWEQNTASAEREGKFYLANPDKILLSEQDASWFIPGVDWMYGVKPHYVLIQDAARSQGMLVWRFRDGRFVPERL